MTKIHAARQLLALGPLTLSEIVEITGWEYRCCVRVLAYLREVRAVRLIHRGAYEAAQ